MKIGAFNIDDYLTRLYENTEGGYIKDPKQPIIIPDINKKSFDWLKKEYQKNQTEVKVEMKMGSTKFEPGYDLQTNLKSIKDFKPGMYGQVKTLDNENKKETKPIKSYKNIENKKISKKPKTNPSTMDKNKKEDTNSKNNVEKKTIFKINLKKK